MRRALQQSAVAERQGTSGPVHIPAPVGGWNTRDSIANMAPTEAPLIDNWFPRASEVVERGGSTDWATGMSGSVQSMMSYLPASGSNILYGVTNAGVYNVTSAGAVGAVVQALTNGYVISVNTTNSAGTSFLWLANGVDTPKMFDGAVWSTPAITGVVSSNNNIIAPWYHKHRLWFIEKGTMNAYFLPIDSVQGAAVQFPLGDLFRKGGYLVAGFAWTIDAGEGPDDLIVFVTSEGQLAVYQGTDPSSTSSFGIVGVWFVGRPMGSRCFFQMAGDTGLITENGVFVLSTLLKGGSVNFSSALSNKIQPSFVAATQAVTPTTLGFEGCVYPAWDALLVNIIPPTTATIQQQFVMNTVTGKWCTFSGWFPLCFFVFSGQLYFGTAGGKVLKAWDAASTLVADNGVDITTTVHQAYNTFGSSGRLKSVDLFRNIFAYTGSVDTRWAISPDFVNVPLTSFAPRSSSTVGSPWDTSSWDVSSWSPEVQRLKIWRAAAHTPGYSLSLWLQTAGNTGTLSWAGTDYILNAGNQGP